MRAGLCLSIVLVLVTCVTAAEKTFRAGAHAMDATPLEFPISMNGNMTDHKATKAHDPIHARCLVLDDGAHKLAIVVVDSCLIRRELMEAAKTLASERTGIPASHMLMSATHTHSAPSVTPVFQTDADEKYIAFLIEKIAAGIEKANGNLLPARIGWAAGRDETQVFNRRWKLKDGRPGRNPFGLDDKVVMNPGYNNADVLEPAGPVDPEVSIVSVQTKAGQPLALLANYSLHYVGGTAGGELSADYFAVFAERIGQLVDANTLSNEKIPPFVGIMTNGTSGDVNNVNFALKTPAKFEPYEKMRLVAESVAQAAKRAYDGIEYHDWVPLAVRESEFELTVRKPTADDLAKAKERLSQAKDTPLRGLPDVYARETTLMAEYPDRVPVKVQAIRIGDLGICAIPCEVFTEIGLELKKRSPFQPMFTISLANGYNGYLPTPAQHALGGYETWRARSSYLETGASPKIVDALLEMLQQLKAAP